MKFLIDAQPPRGLAAHFRHEGLEAIRTLDLPDGNRTTDRTLNELSIKEQYIVVTKDSDFVGSFFLSREPWKLLLVSTGNIANAELEALFVASLERLVQGFEVFDFIEINLATMIFHV